MPDLQDIGRDFLKAALEKSGLSAYALAKKAGVSSTTITRPLNSPEYKFIPKPATLRKIAEAAGLPLPSELAASSMEMEPIARRVPVLGEVQAGAWRELVELEEALDFQPVHLPEYERVQLFALVVVGRSMDMVYPDGTTVIVAPPEEAGLRDGDHVVVRRQRGAMFETTLKEIHSTREGIILQPRSTDPEHQAEIRLTANDGDEGIKIIGVVIQSVAPRRRRSGPLLNLF